MTAAEFKTIFRQVKFDFTNEKIVQQQVKIKLTELGIDFSREYRLDAENIPDFFFTKTGLCVEVKIKGTKKSIYKQLERYTRFDQVQAVLLLTNKSMTLPLAINQKPSYILKMGMAWL
jgi:hypothetical protein